MGGRAPRWESEALPLVRPRGRHAAPTRTPRPCHVFHVVNRSTYNVVLAVRCPHRHAPAVYACHGHGTRIPPTSTREPPCRAVAWARERGETRKGCGVRGRDETCVLRASTGPVPLTQLLSPTFSFCRHPCPFSPPLQVPQAPPPATAIEIRGKAARCALVDSARGCACHPCAAPRRRSAAPPAAATVRGAVDPR